VKCSQLGSSRGGGALVVSSLSSQIAEGGSSNIIALRHLSSTSQNRGILGGLRDTLEERQKRDQAKKFSEQLAKMAASEKWTLALFTDELNSTLSSWRAKIPGLRDLAQVNQTKEAKRLFQAFIDELGGDKTASDLAKLNRTEKLRVSLRSGVSVQELNVAIRQFQSMEIMHQVLRKRHVDGKPLPKDEEAMKAAILTEGASSMTKEQKKGMADFNRKRMRGMRGLGRRMSTLSTDGTIEERVKDS